MPDFRTSGLEPHAEAGGPICATRDAPAQAAAAYQRVSQRAAEAPDTRRESAWLAATLYDQAQQPAQAGAAYDYPQGTEYAQPSDYPAPPDYAYSPVADPEAAVEFAPPYVAPPAYAPPPPPEQVSQAVFDIKSYVMGFAQQRRLLDDAEARKLARGAFDSRMRRLSFEPA